MKELKKLISLKLSEYKSIFNTKDEFYGKDFKNNYKFINGAIKRMLKNKESEDYILTFLDDCIKFHKVSFSMLTLHQDEYFKLIRDKYKQTNNNNLL